MANQKLYYCVYCNTEFEKNNKNKSLYLKYNFCSVNCFKKSGLYYKISQEKRLNTLRDKGVYHTPNIEKIYCKFCNNKFERDKIKDKKYKLNGYCSNKCFKESGDFQRIKIKTELINLGYNINNMTDNEIDKCYRKVISNKNKTDSVYNKWLKTNKEKYGNDFASKRSYKSCKKQKYNFLLINNIIDENKIYSEDEINSLYIKFFNKISKHGEKIKNGRLKKNNYNNEKYILSYKNALLNTIINKMKKNMNIENLSDENFYNFFNKYWNNHFIETKKGKKDNNYIIEWKKTHLKKLNIDIFLLTDEEINNKYSEYLSSRFTKLRDNIHNGYKKTLKGWYKFNNYNSKMFFRSSWELKIYEELDKKDIKNKYNILNIISPKPINYFYKYNRKYFPDIEIVLNNKNIILEIKPFEKLNENLNQAKINQAKNIYNDSFIILTEKEIFLNNVIDKIFKQY